MRAALLLAVSPPSQSADLLLVASVGQLPPSCSRPRGLDLMGRLEPMRRLDPWPVGRRWRLLERRSEAQVETVASRRARAAAAGGPPRTCASPPRGGRPPARSWPAPADSASYRA